MIACCENGLLQRNQRNHFFQIDSISGAKPCDEYENFILDFSIRNFVLCLVVNLMMIMKRL